MKQLLQLATVAAFFTMTSGSCAQDAIVLIKTSHGDIKVKLYDTTPLHSENFAKLVEQGFYDSLIFHRVINGFMIQGGSPDSRYIGPGRAVGVGAAGDVGYVIPNEFDSSVVHKRGMLCAARGADPALATSGCQFYIVQAGALTDAQMNTMETQYGGKIPEEHREIYKTIGGTAHLYLLEFTVFGEVVEGMDVVDKIAAAKRDANDRPLEDVRMYMEVVKK